ncbi:YidC/Oxa1 family membrane protein insertase [Candidatus Peregrinibacteria bacterium]|nr:YidC/Oxa1 family membrane protein insertase [Candidatus Peregrinibacteria bacterium]
MSNKLFKPLLFVLIFLIVFQIFGNKNEQNATQDDVVLVAKSKMVIGKDVTLEIKNNSESVITIPNNCPKNPLIAERYINGEWILQEYEIDPARCEDTKDVEIAPGDKYMLNYGEWGWNIFNEEGKYRIIFNTNIGESEKTYSHEFNMTAPSLIRRFWNEVFFRPIFNTLVLLIKIMPGKNLGWGIIFLTLIIKIILLGPNHKALRAQKAMQKIQPQLDALKIKHKDNPQLLASETMAIWKKYKVSPMSSCLPMLIQFPILIALFYVVKNGLSVINPDILYTTLKDVDLHSINPVFLGFIDLTKVNIIALPIFVGGLQFLQMHLTLGKTKSVKTTDGKPNPMPMMNSMMKYAMPVMIAIFTASLPAAVGFYWGTSTLFGIGQQIIVNRSKI